MKMSLIFPMYVIFHNKYNFPRKKPFRRLLFVYEKLTITVFAPTVPLLVVKDYINYFALYHELVKKGALDLLDIELFANPLAADTLIHEAKKASVASCGITAILQISA
jgi:hypothetical protein